MHHAMKAVVRGGQFVAEAENLLLEFDIAHVDRRITHDLRHALAAFGRAHDVHYAGPRLRKHSADLPSHALAIGNAEHQHRFAAKLQEVHEIAA